ncbi:PTS transporter subunit EIIB, partial [Streptomyces sp. SID11233]|nr:PTS transporter subunit EIIB [Streptomyces sp. SID11233]
MASKAEKIVAGLGGLDNISDIEGCITRLRTEVYDASK